MKFEGHISEIDLIAKLVELGDEQFTGAIRFENDGIIKILYLKDGDILSASTNDRTDSIDEILLKSGKVTRDHIRQALTRRKENETLGDALLGLGFITKKELVWARRVQVVVIIRSILKWPDGTFTIVSDYLPKREEGTIFYLRQILLELIVTDEDRERFDALLRSGDAVFRKEITFDDAYKALALNEEADQVVRLIDGRRSASDVATSSSVEPFSVFKLLHALRVLGLLREVNGKHQVLSPAPVATFGFELDEEPKQEQQVLLPGVMPEPAFSEPEPAIDMSFDAETEPTEGAFNDEQPTPVDSEQDGWSTPMKNDEFTSHDFDTSEEITIPDAPVTSPPIPHAEERRESRSKRPLAAALILILLGGGAYGGYLYWQRIQREEAPAESAQKVARAAVVTPAVAEPAATVTATDGTVLDVATTQTIEPPATITTPPPRVAEKKPEPKAKEKIASDTGFKVEKTASGYSVSNLGDAGKRAPAPAPKSIEPAPANDPLRRRYDAMAQEYAQTRRDTPYTIQFEIVCQTDSVTKAVTAGGSSVWFVPINYQGRNCFRVFWGRYDSSTSAEQGIAEIPAEFRSGKPVVVRPAEVIKP